MIAWVNKVFVPVLILDMYQFHMMALVVQMIQELGVEVKHIPGGCTSLCQPVMPTVISRLRIGYNGSG